MRRYFRTKRIRKDITIKCSFRKNIFEQRFQIHRKNNFKWQAISSFRFRKICGIRLTAWYYDDINDTKRSIYFRSKNENEFGWFIDWDKGVVVDLEPGFVRMRWHSDRWWVEARVIKESIYRIRTCYKSKPCPSRWANIRPWRTSSISNCQITKTRITPRPHNFSNNSSTICRNIFVIW